MNKMKILLIYPYCLEERLHADEVAVPPIGLYYIGALLKENQYDVEILNWHAINKTPQRINNILAKTKPDIIGFSILHANRWGAVEIARIAKKIDKRVRIVFGGIGATFLWKHLLTHFKEIDFCVIGEGERAFLSLTKSIEKEDQTDLDSVRGIAFRRGEDVVRTGDAGFIKDPDRLPNPAKYFSYQHVISSRGCPGNCTFCGSPLFWGRKVRFHSPEYFVNQLELLYKKGIHFFFFSDDTFMLKKGRVIEICREILGRGLKISWVAISRVDLVDEEILHWMRKAGCTQISYGVESGSEEIRNLLNKNIGTEQIKRAFTLTKRYGILTRAYFIYGSPNETWKTIQETIDLIREIKPLSIIFYILDIFPGTSLYSDFLKRSGFTDDIWLRRIEDLMYFETDPDLSRETILVFGKRLRREFYAMLPDFACSLDLIDEKEFHKLHADFLSRLAMTFSHGDYSKIEAIGERQQIAKRLFERSLEYYPNDRGFLGLGIIMQKNMAFRESVKVLSEGVRLFPENEQLNICLGLSYMNLEDYDRALSCFKRFRHSEVAARYMAECWKKGGK